MNPRLIPAAQYLRMSTEHQQFSIANQAARIQEYAIQHGYLIVRSYADEGRSGLLIKNRQALGRLLNDVVSGNEAYRAILVYDVSRWGRFQDSDEAAYYEFICKRSGIPVFYCAESFSDDGSPSSALMKTLKRTMAAEYSRELGVKVRAGQKRLAEMGFSVGANPGYGLRRVMVSADGRRQRHLAPGEYKSLTTDRVRWVLGPKREQEIVRRIFRWVLAGKRPYAIMRLLNAAQIPFTNGKAWDYWNVLGIVRNSKYCGCRAWGRTSQRLGGPNQPLPPSEWTTRELAFPPIVSPSLFDRVQQILNNKRTYSDEQLLSALGRLLKRRGYLSWSLIRQSKNMPSPSAYERRFGSIRAAYARIGYDPVTYEFSPREQRAHSEQLRNLVAERLQTACPARVEIRRVDMHRHPRLLLDGKTELTILICPAYTNSEGHSRWIFYPHTAALNRPLVACALSPNNEKVIALYLFPANTPRQIFKCQEEFLKRGTLLRRRSKFADDVASLIGP